jgi:ferredoxin-NADP reductase
MHTITLQKQEPLAGNIRAFYFSKPHDITWRAGNHAVFFVSLPNYDLGGNSRPLSISSAPGDDHVMVVSHCPAENASAFKQAFALLQPGQTVEMTDPVGEFVLDDNVDNPLLVAAGIGIGAVRAILRDREQRGISLNGDLRYYAPDGQFIFQQELEDMAARHPEFGLQFLAHDIAELGQIKEIEQRVDRKVYMSGVYVQRTDIPDTFDPTEDHIAAREEVTLIEAARKLVGN